MKKITLISHAKGAIGLRFFGLGPNLKPTNSLRKLQKLLDRNASGQKKNYKRFKNALPIVTL